MRPEPGQVLHFSEDPTITSFIPRISAYQQRPEVFVWAVDHRRSPDYWFPRQCPRVMAWTEPDTAPGDRSLVLGTSDRVHAVEYAWLTAMRTVELYAYRLPAERFRPLGADDSAVNGSPAMVCGDSVTPLGPPEPVGDLLALHAQAGIELRVMNNLWQWCDTVSASTVGFSCIRMRNAAARPV